MKYFLILLSFFTLINCNNEHSKKPDENVIKECLSNYFSNKIKINSYQHIDGLPKEKDGVKYYEGYFNAEINFISNYENFKAGDEYKIIKGVLHFMKTENGWNCQEFDFTGSQFIKLNKFDTQTSATIYETNQNIDSTNTVYTSQESEQDVSDNAVKNVVNNYYKAISNKDFNEFYNIFSPHVNFFGKPDYTVSEIIVENKNYQKRWPYYEVNLDENSFNIRNVGSRTNVQYRIFYKVKKKQEDSWKIFDLRMNLILNQNLQIESVNEYKQ
ncbi:hypothetical protein [Chryseobacterium sp.]|uniref:hypothetical protein n=1 Tax=Chryseobacterium sp. TaxID=1871047 RepID=UPI002FC718AE